MILVTGAAGKTGQAVIGALARRGAVVRAMVRRPAQAETVRRLGAQEVVVGDLRRPAEVAAAVQGVQAIYHICPNMAADEIAIAGGVIDAARRAGVRRLVYHSVLHPQVEAMPHHWHKMRVEERLFTAGLPYTILQPAAYMQNVLAGWETIVEQGVYRVPYAVETRLGMVDLLDVAEVAARVLTEPGHEGAIYELAGPEVLTQTEVATCLQNVLGRPVRAETIPRDEWALQVRAAGLGVYAIDTLLQMFHYYEQFGFWGNPRVLAWLLERPPTPFEAFVRRVAGTTD
ncbi:MAG: NAD-dependent epimerase/dehydratase family protein [Caldilineae bacterium]|nr:MAG: NAD-dependent epimerase/dehydratase family protein [Caldilineae bacterium]